MTKNETVYRIRTHKFYIKQTHPYYKKLQEMTHASKNLFNQALYQTRQYFFKENTFLSQSTLNNLLKDTEEYKTLHSYNCQLPSQVLKTVVETTKAFTNATKQYYKNPTTFTGKPKLPRYKPKQGYYNLAFSYQVATIKNNYIHINSCGLHFELPSYLKGLKRKTTPNQIFQGKDINPLELVLLRVIPKQSEFEIEIVYEKELQQELNTEPITRVASIDLGIDNLATLTTTLPSKNPILINGKHLKSYNKHFNKTLADLKSQAMKCNKKHTTKRINILYQKRNKYFNTKMRQIASYITNYLVENKIQLLIIGYNPTWKQNSKLSKQTNQTFMQIPYLKLINILKYKLEEHGIIIKETEEYYTSGTSFLDDEQPIKENYNKNRRVHRGLFRTNKGKLINADVNASYQIMKKIAPTFSIKQLTNPRFFNPIRITI